MLVSKRVFQSRMLVTAATRLLICGFRSTTMSEHEQSVAANVPGRQFDADRPNQRWWATTEFVIGSNAKLYLAAILDLFSRFVVGWAVNGSATPTPKPIGTRNRPIPTFHGWPSLQTQCATVSTPYVG